MNYYVLLGISQDADADTIRSAFRALARRYHPDAGEGSSAERFREILTAYETLNDPARRWHHDRTLQREASAYDAVRRTAEGASRSRADVQRRKRSRAEECSVPIALADATSTSSSTSCFKPGTRCCLALRAAATAFEQPPGALSHVVVIRRS